MSKKLKNLNKHNTQASSTQWASILGQYKDLHHILLRPILNGIACPKCSEELYDSTPTITLTSMPAQKNVHCSKCDHVGYRIA